MSACLATSTMSLKQRLMTAQEFYLQAGFRHGPCYTRADLFANNQHSIVSKFAHTAPRNARNHGLGCFSVNHCNCRELQRRLRVWERRCRQENRPLLQEWIPPAESQRNMSRALGEVRAWKQITVVQKARWGASVWLRPCVFRHRPRTDENCLRQGPTSPGYATLNPD